MNERYLTKSRFKLALECPTKLYYTGKKKYANKKIDDPFLATLAEGGFQIGELAKEYEPGGYDITALDYDEALKQTNELLQKEHVIIYEAALQFEHLFVRVDILKKNGNDIQLIEVKTNAAEDKIAKISEKEDEKVNSTSKPYVYDIAFQYYVAKQALRNYTFTPYLMLVDKKALCPSDELHQKIKLMKDERGRTYAKVVEPLTEEELMNPLLRTFNMRRICEEIIGDHTLEHEDESLSFAEAVALYAEHYVKDEKIEPIIKNHCKSCEFKATDEQLADGFSCGFRECFTDVFSWNEKDFDEPMIFDLWNMHWATTNKLIAENKIKLRDVEKTNFTIQSQSDPSLGLHPSERRWMQVEKAVANDTSYYIDKVNLKKEMDDWIYPYHFIDFETLRPVIPFKRNRTPNEIIAFQFSHHIVEENGTIEHKSEFLETTPGVHPNVAFVRALKKAIGQDNGTVFIYSSHEKMVLNEIYRELQDDESPVEDKEELCAFIDEVLEERPEDNIGEERKFIVDLFELVKRYYYDPHTEGSNSIKDVLPAILNSSTYIQQKYSKPIYGRRGLVKSLNFDNHVWVRFQDGQVVDPYEHLTNLFDGSLQDYKEYEGLFRDINDGGAAMSAYERLQYEYIPTTGRKKVEEALLKYCELDTFAMVIIYEAWVDMMKADET